MDIIYLLCFVVIIIVSFSIYKNTEHFLDNTNLNLKTYKIKNIVPVADSKDIGYILTAINSEQFNPNHLYKIFSLKNINDEKKPKPNPLNNGKIDDTTIIVHLLWYHDELTSGYISTGKRLMCVGLKHIRKGTELVPTYTIYIKENKNIESKWMVFKNQHPDRAIKSIIYDLQDNLLGIDYRDNQIYQYGDISNKWNGPINFNENVQIHKLLFSTEKLMIAIDIHGKIHKHASIDWKSTQWVKLDEINKADKNSDKNIDKTQIIDEFVFFDMVYDYDGKFIALAKHDINDTNNPMLILKQYVQESKFVDYLTNPSVNKEILPQDKILSKNDIIMYKTGIDSDKFDYLTLDDETKLGNINKQELQRKTVAMINLNHYLKIKRTLLQKCKNFRSSFSKKELKKHNINSNISIYNTIETIIQDLDKKYDN